MSELSAQSTESLGLLSLRTTQRIYNKLNLKAE